LKEKPGTGVYVKDLSSFVTKNIQEIEHVMNVGNKNRSVGATNMNEHSSRSHAIFIITIECSQVGADGENHIRVGKLNLVDLAGSERQGKTGAAGTRLKEATKINLSLSALGNVISSLVDDKNTHIPYRDSKLTRLLQDSLGGNSKTVMIATIGPASYNLDESLTTLRFADRAKRIKNKPKINEDPKDAMLRSFQDEINRLRSLMQNKEGGGGKKKKGNRGKKSNRVNEYGEPLEEDDDPEDIEAYMKQEHDKLELEKQAIVNDQTLIGEEKQRLLKDIKEKEKQMEQENEAKMALAQKIKNMESKLLTGGKNIIDHTNEQERRLEEKRYSNFNKFSSKKKINFFNLFFIFRIVLAEEKRKEREMQKMLEQQEENNFGMNQSFSTLQQEVEFKTKKLKKYFAKFQSLKDEIRELTEANDKERQEFEQSQAEMQRDIKVKQLIIENFVPKDEKEKLMNRVYYDQDEDCWKPKVITKEK
jgi:kinesin family member 3B